MDVELLDKEREERERLEKEEHDRKIAENFRMLLEGGVKTAPASEPIGAYEYVGKLQDRIPAYQEGHAEPVRSAPVVPNSPDAPSAVERFRDFVAVKAPAASAAPAAPDAEAPAQRRPLFENLLYQDGQLVDTSAPAAPAPEAPAQDISAPAAPKPSEEEDEDALPTQRTLGTVYRGTAALSLPATAAAGSAQGARREEEKTRSGMVAALSVRTKLVLAAIAAVVVLLLAVVCINTAIINSIRSDVSDREARLGEITGTMNGINEEIERMTSPEYVEQWALEHGMSR